MEQEIFRGKRLNKLLGKERKKFSWKDGLFCLGINAIIVGGILYGIKTYLETPEYQTGLANHTSYTSIVQYPDSIKSLADSLNLKEK